MTGCGDPIYFTCAEYIEVRDQRSRLGRFITDECPHRQHFSRLIADIIFIHVADHGTESSICLHHDVESTIVCRKVIDIQTAHESLNRREDIIDVHTQLFAFLTIYSEAIARCIGIVESKCFGYSRIFICLCYELFYHFFKSMHIVICITLLELHSETDRSTKSGYG